MYFAGKLVYLIVLPSNQLAIKAKTLKLAKSCQFFDNTGQSRYLLFPYPDDGRSEFHIGVSEYIMMIM